MLISRFPTIFKTCLEYNIDIRKDPIPITPVAHYMMGGVATDLWGRSSVKGLYVCGEAARTGVHGANRLASNSLLEASVFAMRVSQIISTDAFQQPEMWQHSKWNSNSQQRSAALSTSQETSTADSLDSFQQLMWDQVGLIRSQQSLQKALHYLTPQVAPQRSPQKGSDFELQAMKLLAGLMVESAWERNESRGAHFREDYPKAQDLPLPAIRKSIYQNT